MDIRSTEEQLRDNPTQIPDRDLYIIVGANNSGKSTFLREVVKTVGETGHRIDVNRTVLYGEGALDKDYEKNKSNNLSRHRNAKDDNTSFDRRSLQELFLLSDEQRKSIVDWYNQYFPNSIYEERENTENSASPMLLMVNGYSITKQGSGMRATLEIFVKLFDPSITVLCIDEPELGLEPYLQKYLFRAIKDKVGPNKKVFIATHSHHFLDFEVEQNNFRCERDSEDNIFLTQIDDLKSVIFRLLGNTLSSFLLPERVLVLEGPSDTLFLNKAMRLLGKANYSYHNSRGAGNITYAINSITQFLRFNREHLPVYSDRIYILVDRVDQRATMREWQRIVPDPGSQICMLPQNGIEYFYPERILQQIFNTTESRADIVNGYLASGVNVFNGVRVSKTELSKLVAEELTHEDLTDTENDLYQFLESLP